MSKLKLGNKIFYMKHFDLQDSGVGSIGLGGKNTWNVDDEMEELKDEGTKKSTQKSQKTNIDKPVPGMVVFLYCLLSFIIMTSFCVLLDCLILIQSAV
jgi:hypothetical protein